MQFPLLQWLKNHIFDGNSNTINDADTCYSVRELLDGNFGSGGRWMQ